MFWDVHAEDVRRSGCRPLVWVRPLVAAPGQTQRRGSGAVREAGLGDTTLRGDVYM